MLVINRHPGESIIIDAAGEIIKMQINKIYAGNHTVTVGFYAPRHIKIFRDEIYAQHQLKAGVPRELIDYYQRQEQWRQQEKMQL